MRYVDSRGLFFVALIIQLNKYTAHCSMVVPYFPGLVVKPICDDLYRAKYENFYTNSRSHSAPFENQMIYFTKNPLEFMSVERSSNEFLFGSSKESTEFMTHDNRDNQSPFIDFNERRKEISSRDPAKQERKMKKTNATLVGGEKNVTSKPRKQGRGGKSRGKAEKKSGRFHSPSATFNGLSTKNIMKNSKLTLRDFGWANLACGSTRRIVGGWIPESIEKLPYMVFIDTGCGGAIIGSRWVITAAHCIVEQEPAYVYVGSVEILSGCQYIVAAIHVHPQFSQEELQSDIGLINIKPSFVYSPAIKPVALTKIRGRYKMCGVVAGWGARHYNGSMSTQLMMAYIPIVGRKKCRKFRLKKGELCAGHLSGKADSCQGDSGGGFVVDDRLVGIVSYGDECAKPRSPGVYVDVFHYLNWIKRITGIS